MPTDQALRGMVQRPPLTLLPYVVPTGIMLCLTGLIWEVKTQTGTEQRLQAVTEKQKQVISDLKTLTERIDREDTPLSKHVNLMEVTIVSRLQRIEDDTKHLDVMQRDVEELKRIKK